LCCGIDFWFFPGLPAAAIEPVPESNVSKVEERSQEERERWWKMGLKSISDGKVAVLLLSGGQVCSIFSNCFRWRRLTSFNFYLF